MTEVQLLDKTEIWVRGVKAADVDLPLVATVAAAVLGMPPDRVFVTDLGPDHICFDILMPRLMLDSFAGKQQALLAALAEIPGITIAPDAAIHSEGILGLIGAPAESISGILSEAARMEDGIRAYVSKRVAVVSTGAELVDGSVHDTNFEAVEEFFAPEGYEVEFGGTVGDDLQGIAGRVARLAGDDGFGIVITTGGVGAEAKDKTIEAVELLDPDLSTAALAHFQRGHGRHVKDTIRIAVARVGFGLVVSLPGPTHEVRLALPILLEGLRRNASPGELVEAMAVPLRAKLVHAHHH